jgi:phosphinothricin acetyltransferase
MSDFSLRPMSADDWPEVARIYAAGIDTGNATFETEVPTWERWDSHHADDCRLVAETSRGLLGWAAISPVSSREVYRGVAEVSVYVDPESRGTGVGSALMRGLVAASEGAGYWTLYTAIFPENEASLALHTRHGFRVVGRRERIGQHHGRWRDTVLLERRSGRVGI